MRYKIYPQPGDTSVVTMRGDFSIDELINIIDEMKEADEKQYKKDRLLQRIESFQHTLMYADEIESQKLTSTIRKLLAELGNLEDDLSHT